MYLKQEDRDVLNKKGLLSSQISQKKPVLNRWSKLLTTYIRPYSDFKDERPELDFIKRKYIDPMSVQELVINAPGDEMYDTWLVEDNKSLEKNSSDWTDAIPGKRKMDFSENSLFDPLPKSHYQYDKDIYPSYDNARTRTALLSIGSYYGFEEN